MCAPSLGTLVRDACIRLLCSSRPASVRAGRERGQRRSVPIRTGSDQREADIPRASGAGRSDQNDPLRSQRSSLLPYIIACYPWSGWAAPTRFRTFQGWHKDFSASLRQVERAVDRPAVSQASEGSPMFDMRRREFITFLGAAAARPISARAAVGADAAAFRVDGGRGISPVCCRKTSRLEDERSRGKWP
jgi:hypothetical protein